MTTRLCFQEYYVPCTLSKKPLLILHFILRMKLSPILCFTNSREAAHRWERASPRKHITSFLQSAADPISWLFAPLQAVSAGAALWWRSGGRVLLQTVSCWEEEDAEGVWTRKDPTVSVLCINTFVSENMWRLRHTVIIYWQVITHINTKKLKRPHYSLTVFLFPCTLSIFPSVVQISLL